MKNFSVKVLSVRRLTNAQKKEIVHLMDLFVKPKGRKSIPFKNIGKVVQEKNNTVISVLDGAKIVGLAVLVEQNLFTAKLGIIDEIAVDQDYRGKGLASMLMLKIIKIAKKKGMDLLKVDTNSKNNAANGLYQKFNFKKRNDNVYKLFLNENL